MTLAYILALAAVVAIVVLTRQPRPRPQLELGEPVDALDASIRQLADRVTIAESTNRKLRLIIRIGGAALVALALVVIAVKQQGDDIITARAQGRRAVCDSIQAQTDALVNATGADRPTVTAYVDDLNSHLGVIDCTITVNIPGG